MPERIVYWRALADFSKVRTEAAKTKASIKSLNDEVDKSNSSIEDLGKSNDSLAQKIEHVGNETAASAKKVSEAQENVTAATDKTTQSRLSDLVAQARQNTQSAKSVIQKRQEQKATEDVKKAEENLSAARSAQARAAAKVGVAERALTKTQNDSTKTLEDISKATEKVAEERATATKATEKLRAANNNLITAQKNQTAVQANITYQNAKDTEKFVQNEDRKARAAEATQKREQAASERQDRIDARATAARQDRLDAAARRDAARAAREDASDAAYSARAEKRNNTLLSEYDRLVNAKHAAESTQQRSAPDRTVSAPIQQRVDNVKDVISNTSDSKLTNARAAAADALTRAELQLKAARDAEASTYARINAAEEKLAVARANTASVDSALRSATADVDDAIVKYGADSRQALDADTRRISVGNALLRAHAAEREAQNGVTRASHGLEEAGDRVERSLSRLVATTGKAERAFKGAGGGGNIFTRSLKGLFDGFENAYSNIGKFTSKLKAIRWPALAAGAYLLAEALSTVVGGLFELASAVAPAIGGLAAILPTAYALGGALLSVKAAFSGVSGVLKAYSAQQTKTAATGATTAKKEADNADQIKNAQQSLAEARANVGAVYKQGAEQVSDASRSIVEATQNETDAQQQLNDARVAAKKNIQDLKNATIDAALAERAATLDLADAKDNLQHVLDDPNSTRSDRERAQLQVDQASQSSKEATQSSSDSKVAATTAVANGVEGDSNVIDAKKQLADATQAVTKAERDYSDTLASASSDNAKAIRAVDTAQRALVKTKRDDSVATGAAATAANDYNAKLAALPLSAQKFVKQLISMKHYWTDLKTTAADNLFPGLTKGLNLLPKLFPVARSGIAGISHEVGELGFSLAKAFTSKEWISSFKKLNTSSVVILNNLGRGSKKQSGALLNLLDVFRIVMTAAIPLTEKLSKGIQGWTKNLDDSTKAAEKSGKLSAFFEKSYDTIHQLGQILKNVATGIFNIGKAAQGSGKSMLDSMQNLTKKWADWTKSIKGQNELKKYFADVRTNMEYIDHLIWKLTTGFLGMGDNKNFKPILNGIADIWSAIKSAFGGNGKGVSDQFVSLLHTVANVIRDVTKEHSGLKVFITILGTLLTVFDGFLKIPGIAPLLGVLFAAFAAFSALKLLGVIKLLKGLGNAFRSVKSDADGTGSALSKFASGTKKVAVGAAKAAVAVAKGIASVATKIFNRNSSDAEETTPSSTSSSGSVAASSRRRAQAVAARRVAASAPPEVIPSVPAAASARRRASATAARAAAARSSAVPTRVLTGRQSINLNTGVITDPDDPTQGLISGTNRRLGRSEEETTRPGSGARAGTPDEDASTGGRHRRPSRARRAVQAVRSRLPDRDDDTGSASVGLLTGGMFGRVHAEGNEDDAPKTKRQKVARGVSRVAGAGAGVAAIAGLAGTIPGLQKYQGLLNTIAIATGVLSAATEVLSVALESEKVAAIASAIATKVQAAAQWLLDAAMDANPIVLVVAAIAALAAGFIYAYKHSETFRGIVSAIGDIFVWLWKKVLLPIVDFFANNWQTILKIAVAVLAPFILVVKEIIKHWSTIVGFFKALWGMVIKAFSDAWAIIKAAATIAWNAIKDVIINPIENAFNTIKSAWNSVWGWLKSAFSSAKSWIAGIWNTIAGSISNAFSGVGAALSTVWDGVKRIFAGAVNFVTQKILDPLIGAINTVTHIFGIPQIPKIPAITVGDSGGVSSKAATTAGPGARAHATGGVTDIGSTVPGYTPGRDPHEFVSNTGYRVKLSGGEGILTPETTRALGGKPGIDALNAQHSPRLRERASFMGVGRESHADGGLTGATKGTSDQKTGYNTWALWRLLKKHGGIGSGVLGAIGKVASAGVGLLRKGAGAVVKATFEAAESPIRLLINHIPGGKNTFIPKAINGLFDKVNKGIYDTIAGKNKRAKNGTSVDNDGKYTGQVTGASAQNDIMASGLVLNNRAGSGANPFKDNFGSQVISTNAANVAALRTIISNESGWNAAAQNNTDLNAKAGHPSQGLMQTILGTYNAYKNPNLDRGMKDGISNVAAGVNYANSRYGGLPNVPGVKAVNSGGKYVGYGKGGVVQNFHTGGVVKGTTYADGSLVGLNTQSDNSAIAALVAQAGLNFPKGAGRWTGALSNVYKARLAGVDKAHDVSHTTDAPRVQAPLSGDSSATKRLMGWLDSHGTPTYGRFWQHEPVDVDSDYPNSHHRNPLLPILSYVGNPKVWQQYRTKKDAAYWAAKTKKDNDKLSGKTTTKNSKVETTHKGFKNMESVKKFIHSADNKPYKYGAAGPDAYDCSGLTGEVWARLTGHPSYHHYFSTADEGKYFSPGKGDGVYVVGYSHNSKEEHTAGRLDGLKFEARSTNQGIIVGDQARNPESFAHVGYLPAQNIKGVKGVSQKIKAKKLTVAEDKKKHPKALANQRKQDKQWAADLKMMANATNQEKRRILELRKHLGLNGAGNNDGLYSTDMVNPMDHAAAHALKHEHPADWQHPWTGAVTAAESALADSDRSNALNTEWFADLGTLAAWGFEDLVDYLLDKGVADGLAIARSAVKDKNTAEQLNSSIHAGTVTGGVNGDDQTTILKIIAKLGSGTSAHPFGLRDVAADLNVADYVPVNLYDEMTKQLKKLPDSLTKKFKSDVSQFRKGTFYASTGGLVPGDRGKANVDTVPAMLVPGEGVLTRKAMDLIGGEPSLNKLNMGLTPQAFADGGMILSPTFADMSLNSSAKNTIDARNVRTNSRTSSGPANITLATTINNPSDKPSIYDINKNLQRQAALGTIAKIAGN